MTLLDLFCGRGGWSRPALARGWHAIGYDNTDHGYPGAFVLATLPAAVEELKSHRPDLVLVSPPCQEFARHHLPWIKGPAPSLDLLRWSIGLVGQFDCPVIVECSRFAGWHIPPHASAGSYALWGDVPAIFPPIPRKKGSHSGKDPARRAMIEPELANWILETIERRADL